MNELERISDVTPLTCCARDYASIRDTAAVCTFVCLRPAYTTIVYELLQQTATAGVYKLQIVDITVSSKLIGRSSISQIEVIDTVFQLSEF